MIPSEYGSSAPTSSKSLAHEVGDEQPPALVELRAVERARQQLQLRELHRLVDVAEDAVHVGARLDQLRREPERLRRRVRVLEPSRVGDEPDVERLGDLGRQLHAELPEQVAHDLGRRRGVGDDQVRRAEPRVVVVMVDVDDGLGVVEDRRILADTACVGAVDGDEHALRDVRRQLAQHLVEAHEPEFGGHVGRAGQVHERVLAELTQAERHREHRPERVAVRIFVRDYEKAIVRGERGEHTFEVSRRLLLRLLCHLSRPPALPRRSASSCGCRAPRRDRIQMRGAESS